MKKLNTEEWINKAKSVHGDKYDYSKSIYINSREKVKIICPKHGEFWQKANEHLNGHGCKLCGGTSKLNTNDFIAKSREVHGDKYNYSLVDYKSMRDKVCIICPKHGEFWQLPLSHLNGSACPKCKGVNLTNEEWINKAKEIHGNKYDYSKTVYINSYEKIKIICPKHGEFWQLPSKHIMGQGCPKCGIDNRVNKQFLSTNDFIAKSREVHGDKYNYSLVDYKSMREKVCIICPKHGEFWQYPFDHINEHGCPKCGMIMSKSEEEIYDFLIHRIDENEVIMHDRTILNGKEMTLNNIKIALDIYFNDYINKEELVNKIYSEVIKHYMLDLLIGNNDNGEYNYEMMVSKDNAYLSPYSDFGLTFNFTSTRLRVNEEVNNSIYSNLKILLKEDKYYQEFINMYNKLNPFILEELIENIEQKRKIALDDNFKNIIFLSYSKHYMLVRNILEMLRNKNKIK